MAFSGPWVLAMRAMVSANWAGGGRVWYLGSVLRVSWWVCHSKASLRMVPGESCMLHSVEAYWVSVTMVLRKALPWGVQ